MQFFRSFGLQIYWTVHFLSPFTIVTVQKFEPRLKLSNEHCFHSQLSEPFRFCQYYFSILQLARSIMFCCDMLFRVFESVRLSASGSCGGVMITLFMCTISRWKDLEKANLFAFVWGNFVIGVFCPVCSG